MFILLFDQLHQFLLLYCIDGDEEYDTDQSRFGSGGSGKMIILYSTIILEKSIN